MPFSIDKRLASLESLDGIDSKVDTTGTLIRNGVIAR